MIRSLRSRFVTSFAHGSNGVWFRIVLGIVFTKPLTEAPSGHTYALAKCVLKEVTTPDGVRPQSQNQDSTSQVRNRGNIATAC